MRIHHQERNEILSEVSSRWRAKKLDTDIRTADSALNSGQGVKKNSHLLFVSEHYVINFLLMHWMDLDLELCISWYIHWVLFSFVQSYHCYDKKYKGFPNKANCSFVVFKVRFN